MADVSKIGANGIDYKVKDAVARADIATANSNISSLTTDLETAEGNITSLGTRMTSAEGNIDSLQSQINSLVTGGTGYVKLPDGTMVCYGAKSADSGNNRVNYPASFSATPSIVLTPSASATVYVGTNTSTYFLLNTSASATVYWIAVGRWS